MLFSSLFEIDKTPDDDWFDPDLAIDTKLFVDPFLLLLEEDQADSSWNKSHERLIWHFTHCYALLAKGAGAGMLSEQTAHSLLLFPEPEELCLGYVASGTRGAGGGGARARLMIGSIVVAIAAGITEPQHIEEVGILNKGIGADGISDATCNILKSELIAYTLDIVKRHAISTTEVSVRNAHCDLNTGRWASETYELPVNPNNGKAVLLVPKRFLGRLPTLNADDWFDCSLNEDLRRSVNVAVGQKVSKDTIVDFAKRHPRRIREYAQQLRDAGSVTGYDFDADPLGVINWHAAGEEFAATNTLSSSQPKTQAELHSFIAEVLGLYRLFIEEQGGWRLLWNEDGTEKPEDAAQLALIAIARPYCRAHGVEIDREVNFGRGPVDFKISTGIGLRLLVEIKKVHNGKFWNGLESQLPSYLKSDATTHGWYVGVRYRHTGVSKDRPREIAPRLETLNKALGTSIKFQLVDATAKKSASKL